MKPVSFPGHDAVLGGPQGWDEAHFGPVRGLPIKRVDGTCISKWSLTWRERWAILFGKPVVLQIVARTQPPCVLYIDGVK